MAAMRLRKPPKLSPGDKVAAVTLSWGGPGSILESDFDLYDQALTTVVRDELGLVDLPIITRMDFGHTDPMFVLPYGCEAVIDCERQTLSIPEPAVIAE